jgi:hypothetical protein
VLKNVFYASCGAAIPKAQEASLQDNTSTTKIKRYFLEFWH